MAADEVSGFEWIQSSVLRDGACVTLVATADGAPPAVDTIVRGFGGDPAAGRLASLVGLGMPPPDQPVLAIRALRPWLLAVEPNGWQGSRPEVLRRISAGGRVVSAYWNINHTTRFCYAAGGQLLTAFEVMSPGRRDGVDPDCLEEARAGLPWETGDWVPLMLALASRVTGLRVARDWLEGEFTVVPVTPVDEGPTAEVNPATESLTYEDGPLSWALRRADDAARIRVAGIAARYAADEAAGYDARTPRGRDSSGQTATTRQDRARTGPWFWAKTAAREASGLDPLAAAFKSVTAAKLCLQSLRVPDDGLRAELLSALGNPAPPAGSLGLTAIAGSAPTDRYLWTREHWLAPVGVLRFTRGAGLNEVAEAVGADPGTARDGIPALSREVVAFRRVGDWLVAVEGPFQRAGGVRKSRPMPAGTITVNLIWQARGRSWVQYMAGDTLVAGLDPQRPDQRLGSDPAFLDPYAAGLPLPFVPEGHAAAQLPAMLVIAERLTGLAFAPQWLDEPHVLMAW